MTSFLNKQFGKNASDEKLNLLVYSIDASQIEGKASAVIWPASKEDVYKVIRYAHRTDSTITPRGAGTGLAGAAVPQDSIVVDFSKMDKIIKIDPKSKTTIVEPGVILDNLNKELAKHNLFFPVIPASHKVCTIGGMISTNAAGMRAIRYGKTMDWIKGLEIIDGMGRVMTANDKNIKHFCGREGTTGIIIKAKLNLAELTKTRSLDIFKLETISELMDVVKSLNPEKLNAIEFIDKIAARIAGLKSLYYYLFVEYNDDTGEIFDEKDIDESWKMREDVGIVLSSEGYGIKEDPKIPLKDIPQFISWLEQHDIPSFGHLGIGILHPRFKTSDLIPEMYRLVEELGGEVSGEHGIGLKKKGYVKEDFRQTMRMLKKKYDPEAILNKNKLIDSNNQDNQNETKTQ